MVRMKTLSPELNFCGERVLCESRNIVDKTGLFCLYSCFLHDCLVFVSHAEIPVLVQGS